MMAVLLRYSALVSCAHLFFLICFLFCKSAPVHCNSVIQLTNNRGQTSCKPAMEDQQMEDQEMFRYLEPEDGPDGFGENVNEPMCYFLYTYFVFHDIVLSTVSYNDVLCANLPTLRHLLPLLLQNLPP